MNFAIVSDGACDLLPEYTQAHDVTIVPFYVTFDGTNYTKEGEGIDHDTFYGRMVDEHAVPKSSLPSVGDFTEAFLPLVEKGLPVICICITTKFSGSYNSARTAASQIMDENPKAQITVIDSTLNTMCQALLVNEVVRMRDDGVSYEDAITHIEDIKRTGRIYFTIGSLEYLIKNGRIGKLAVIASDKLGIRPTIIMKDGDISLGGVSRSRKKSKQSVLNALKKYITNEINPDEYNFIVGYGYDATEGAEFASEVKEQLHIPLREDIKARIGTTIGCHTGPYPIGVGLLKKYDA